MKNLFLDTAQMAGGSIPLSLALGAAPSVQSALISLVSSALMALGKHFFQKRRARRAARKTNV